MQFANNFLVDEEDLNSSTEKEGVEVFFFPDESNMKQKHTFSETMDKPIEDDKTIDNDILLLGVLEEAIEAKPTNAQVAKDLGDPTSTPKGTPKKSKRKKVQVLLIHTATEIRISLPSSQVWFPVEPIQGTNFLNWFLSACSA